MPPPLFACPFAIVRLEIATVLPAATLNTRLLLFPFIVRPLVVGPLMVRLLSINSSPPVRTIGLVTRDISKVILAPTQLSMIAWRKLPDPLSSLLVTTDEAEQTSRFAVLLATPVPPLLEVIVPPPFTVLL